MNREPIGQRSFASQQLTLKGASHPEEFGHKTKGLQQLTTEEAKLPASFGSHVKNLANKIRKFVIYLKTSWFGQKMVGQAYVVSYVTN